MNGDREAVRALLKQGADVNAVQGDGVTALHWAATRGDAEHGAHAASSPARTCARRHASAATRRCTSPPSAATPPSSQALVKAGADANATTLRGTTPLMLAAALGRHRDARARSSTPAPTSTRAKPSAVTRALMFAAAANRLPAVKLLLARGADPAIATKVIDLSALSRDGANPDGRNLAGTRRRDRAPAARPAADGRARACAGLDRQYFFNELVHAQGGMTPLHFAVAAGLHRRRAARCSTPAWTSTSSRAATSASPLLIATVNGQFDLGVDAARARRRSRIWPARTAWRRSLPSINLQWAQEAGYPQPWAHLDQKMGYLAYMKLLLEKGADPNARLTKKVWYSGYNFDLSGVDEVGATPFWRAAYGADVDAMKLLVALRRRSAHSDRPSRQAVRGPATPTSARSSTSRACRRSRPAVPAFRRSTRRPAPATARASPPTRIATRRAACSRR